MRKTLCTPKHLKTAMQRILQLTCDSFFVADCIQALRTKTSTNTLNLLYKP